MCDAGVHQVRHVLVDQAVVDHAAVTPRLDQVSVAQQAQLMHLPETMITAIAALALLGFPVAIALAWVFDRTPDGLTRTPEAKTGEITTIVSQPAGSRWPAGMRFVVDQPQAGSARPAAQAA